MKKNLFIIIVLLIVSGQVMAKSSITQPDAFGSSIVLTNIDKSSFGAGGGPDGTGAGPGIEFYLRYNFTPKVFLTVGTGIQTATDKMLSMDAFRTTLLPTFEIKGGIRPVAGNFSPVIFAGLQAFGHQTTYDMGPPVGKVTDDRYYDAAFLIGAGAEVAVSPKVSLMASGDYRYVFSSDDDPKPKFWVAKAGFTYHLKKKTDYYREEIEYPLDESELANLDDLFLEDNSKGSKVQSDEELADLLFTPEEEAGGDVSFDDFGTFEEEYPDSEEGKFNQSMDNLKGKMNQKTNMLADLQSRVEATEKELAKLRSQGVGYGGMTDGASIGTLSDSQFKQQYESALNLFYNKQYQQAITSFGNLMKSNPNHTLASNCQYWIGESYNGLKQYSQAISAFNMVLQYPKSFKFDDALLMSGIVNMKLGNTEQAKSNFETLVNKYPSSEYTNKAMRYLGRL